MSMGRTAWISTLGAVRGTRTGPRGRRCARLHRVFSRLETKRKIIADDAFLKGIDQQILNSPQQRSGSHRASPWDCEFRPEKRNVPGCRPGRSLCRGGEAHATFIGSMGSVFDADTRRSNSLPAVEDCSSHCVLPAMRPFQPFPPLPESRGSFLPFSIECLSQTNVNVFYASASVRPKMSLFRDIGVQ